MELLDIVFGCMMFSIFVSYIDRNEVFVLNIIINFSNKSKIYIFFNEVLIYYFVN